MRPGFTKSAKRFMGNRKTVPSPRTHTKLESIHVEPKDHLPESPPDCPERRSWLLASRIIHSSAKSFLQSIVNSDHIKFPELRRSGTVSLNDNFKEISSMELVENSSECEY